ncbi:MAG: choloylglycine hydrolase family protein [Bacteroidales bacterium]|nr:choloylglycine hydrolase family protein [Bacteroidales bacterium]
MKLLTRFTVIICLMILIGSSDVFSCTVFRLQAKDGSLMVARSMEFGVDLHYDLLVVPRNKQYASPFATGINGLKWTTRYGYIGVTSFGLDHGISDGMNEKGLAIALLWYESDMKWQDVTKADSSVALAQLVFGDWVLGSFATVDELRNAIAKVKVFNYTDPTTGLALTAHFIVYDALGECVVVEYDKGMCNIYDNSLGIMTNAPSFPWQVTNLRQYIGMNPVSPVPLKSAGLTLTATGHGAGMIGLPGDYSPPSRFVRLGMLTRFVDQQPDAAHNLNLCNHVINTFTIPFGIIYDVTPAGKPVNKESTQWVTFRDLTNQILYFKTYDNQTLRKIDLKKLDFGGKELKRISMYGTPESIVEITK